MPAARLALIVFAAAETPQKNRLRFRRLAGFPRSAATAIAGRAAVKAARAIAEATAATTIARIEARKAAVAMAAGRSRQ
ncbi:hypothetical protein ACC754_43750, partial [Rhizobium johnstonii]